eukprot:TRINITY_DN73769_c0_g1_i1.p2 TRINITY_DN73769_c0_g1~~TRINITY_DN73769_c0_g1_i1.p2  ORF type:complete len:1019 (-),score=93.83 TRINITY_DN73769_c0_g1_i1:2947-5955(-)
MVNDTYGHDTGDVIIKGLADTLRESIREADLAIRFGGEEFLVLLHSPTEDGAMLVAENLRKTFEKKIFSAGNENISKTISIGVSFFPGDGDAVWKAIKFADIALYKAKDGGRNQVVRFSKTMRENSDKYQKGYIIKKIYITLPAFIVIVFWTISIFLGQEGLVGSFGKLVALESIKYLGLFAYLFPLLLLYPIYKLYKDPRLDIRSAERITAGLLLLVSVLIFEAMVFSFPFDSYFGVSITRFLEPFIGAVGVWLFWLMLVLMGIFIYFDLDFEDVKEMLNGKFDAFKKQKQEERELAESEEEIKAIIKNELTKKESETTQRVYDQENREDRVVIQEEADKLQDVIQEDERSDEIAIKMYEVREEDEEKYTSMVRLIDSSEEETQGKNTQTKEPVLPQNSNETLEAETVEKKEEIEEPVIYKEPEPVPTPKETTQPQVRPLTHESKIVKELEENKELLSSIEQGDRDKPKDFQLPHMEFLKEAPSKGVHIDESEIDEKIEDLLDKLQRFKIEGDVVRTYSGPIVTTFEFRPAPNVKVSKILNLEDDLAMALKAKTIRIQAPVPGKDVVGIEIPNKEFDTIYLRDVLESELFEKAASPLTIALGKDIVGNPFITDLKKLPHLLIAGTTGSGKSVGINAMILSLLYRNSPDDLKFLMIDPKMLEFSIYNDIPHLLTPVITQPKQAVTALNNMVAEMERRYTLMSSSRTKNIENYNKKISESGGEELPYIVVIIDELADLMMTSGKDVEHSIGRLAQMARASGIHLIVATQRPSVDVVTGLIKANLPSRISFRVGQKIDSKVILDGFGAESLLGRGDMLFTPPGMVGLVRLHAPWVSEPEIEEIVEFLKAQREPEYNEDFLRKESTISKNNEILSTPNDVDELFEEAKEIVMSDKKTSISYLQRKLQIGYNRSATLVEQLEAAGVLSAPNAKGNREVLIQGHPLMRVSQESLSPQKELLVSLETRLILPLLYHLDIYHSSAFCFLDKLQMHSPHSRYFFQTLLSL